MNNGQNRRLSGYSLIEAMVSVIVVAIAVVGAITALSAMTRSEDRALTTEKMQRLASEKYDEIISTEDYINTSLSGNFDDRNESGYSWQVDVATTDETNLDSITVTVTKDSGSQAQPVKVVGLVYVPESTTSGSSTSSSSSSSTSGASR